MMKDELIKTLMLASELEQGLADLYLCLSESHPGLMGLWMKLIQEEHQHAEAIRKLYQLTYEGACRFDAGAIKCDAVRSMVDYVKGTLADVKCRPRSAVASVSLVYELERSLVEKDIFAHFKVAPEYAETLGVLQAGTLRHIQLAKEALDKLRARGAAPAAGKGTPA